MHNGRAVQLLRFDTQSSSLSSWNCVIARKWNSFPNFEITYCRALGHCCMNGNLEMANSFCRSFSTGDCICIFFVAASFSASLEFGRPKRFRRK